MVLAKGAKSLSSKFTVEIKIVKKCQIHDNKLKDHMNLSKKKCNSVDHSKITHLGKNYLKIK